MYIKIYILSIYSHIYTINISIFFSPYIFYIELILEKYRFELCGSPYMQIFFSKYIVGPTYPQVLHPQIQPNVDSKLNTSSTVGRIRSCRTGEYRGQTMGLEHPSVLVSTTGPGTNPPQTPRDDCIWRYIYT